MKKLFTAILLVFVVFNAYAQDVITKKGKSTITCKVVETTDTENRDDNITDIFGFDSQNCEEADLGENEILNKGINEDINSMGFNTLDFLKRDDLLRRSRFCRITGWYTLPAGLVCTILGFITMGNNNSGAIALTVGGFLDMCVGGILIGRAYVLRRKALEIDVAYLYEKSFHIDDNVFSVGASVLSDNHRTNGIGVGMRYNF